MALPSEAASGRHPSIVGHARHLDPNPDLPPWLREVSTLFATCAVHLLDAVATDDPQLARALDTLVQAKDYGVRAARVDLDARSAARQSP
jgi:hypothetical protein